MSGDTTRAGGRDGDGGGGAAHALPHGASHWDRIPRELHDGILDTAGPLTRLTASNPHPAEVRCMSRQDRERLWADVVELDWQGNLAVLPPLPLQSVLLGARSRSLLQRLSEQRIVDKETQQRIAIRNGWHDLLDVNDKRSLASAVVAEGGLYLLKHLVDELKAIQLDTWLGGQALRHGHLDIAKFIHERLPGASWHWNVMSAAAESGRLDCLIWVHDVLGHSYANQPLNTACRLGHIHLIEHLLDQPDVTVSEYAVYLAALNGHVQALDFLLSRLPETFLQPNFSIRRICKLGTLMWLHQREHKFDTMQALSNSVDDGDTDSARWLCNRFDVQFTQGMLKIAIRQNSLPMVKFMLSRPGIRVTKEDVEEAVLSSVGSLLLLLALESEFARVAADSAARENLADFLDWLHTRYPGCIAQSTLAAAVKDRSKDAVEYLLETVHDVEWDLAAIKQIETSDEVAGLIDRHMNSRR